MEIKIVYVSFEYLQLLLNQGEEHENVTRERRNRWIAAISRDDINSKDVLQNERVCGRHFVSGQPAQNWDRFNVDWIPNLYLGKKHKQIDVESVTERAERAKARRKSAIERQQWEAAKKRKLINESGQRVATIGFAGTSSSSLEAVERDCNQAIAVMEMQPEDPQSIEFEDPQTTTAGSACVSEPSVTNVESTVMDSETQTEEFEVMDTKTQTEEFEVMDSETQTEEFEFMFSRPIGYQAPDKEFFKSEEKSAFTRDYLPLRSLWLSSNTCLHL